MLVPDMSIAFKGKDSKDVFFPDLPWANRMRGLKDQDYVISTVGEPDSVDTAATRSGGRPSKQTEDGRWIMMPFMNSGSSLDRTMLWGASGAIPRPFGLVYGLL